MADNATGNSGGIELEAKRRADGSWHSCQVSLLSCKSSSGGLSVKLDGQDSEEIIFSVKDVFTCLRVRSVPLCPDDCSCIDEGEKVLAACEHDSDKLYFDAVVEKTIKVRHSKRSFCRCSFIIKWLSQGVENKTSIILSGSIMKLAAESTNSHPVIASFLNSVKNSSFSTPSLSPTTHDENEVEIDIHALLEKQIKEIGSLANASKNELLRDTLSGIDYGQSTIQVGVTCRNNSLKRSGRKQERKSVPSSAEKLVDNKSPVNPLAARAILASLVSKLPKKIAFVDVEDRKCVSVSDHTEQNDVSPEKMSSMLMSQGSDSHTDKYSETADAKSLDNEKVQIIDREDVFCKNYHAQKSCEELVIEGSSKNEVLCHAGEGKSSSMQPSRGRRLTRSVTKREGVSVNGEGECRTMTVDMISGKVTRSTSNKRTRSSFDEFKEALQDKPVRLTRSTSASIKRESKQLKGEDKTSTLDLREKYKILANATHMTRSTGRETTGNFGDKVREALEGLPATQCSHLDSDEEPDCLPDPSGSTKRRDSLLVNADHELVQSNKKQKRLDAVGKTQRTTAEHQRSGLNNQSQSRSISSKSRPLRFSPRLRFPPQTSSEA